jgi:tRNA(fMet)-specific endonuclease VapC
LILDTNAISAYAEGIHGAVSVVESAPLVALPAVAIGEYRYGIALSRRRSNYESWLDRFISLTRVLEISLETTFWYAALRVELRQTGMPIPANDLWIAALARQHGFPVMSRDAHFDRVPNLRRISW